MLQISIPNILEEIRTVSEYFDVFCEKNDSILDLLLISR